jgi:hypothetical protein
MLKPNSMLEKLAETNKQSLDISYTNIFEYYTERAAYLKNICLAEFAASIKQVFYKINYDSENEDFDDDEITENNGEKKIFIIRGKKFHERKFYQIIRYVRYDIFKDPVNYFREQLLLFLPWIDEDKDINSKNYEQYYIKYYDIIKDNRNKFTIRK